jgi:hypothetical protein
MRKSAFAALIHLRVTRANPADMVHICYQTSAANQVLWTLLQLSSVLWCRCAIEHLRTMLVCCIVYSRMPKIHPMLVCAYLNELYRYSLDSKCSGHSWSCSQYSHADVRSSICAHYGGNNHSMVDKVYSLYVQWIPPQRRCMIEHMRCSAVNRPLNNCYLHSAHVRSSICAVEVFTALQRTCSIMHVRHGGNNQN